MRLIALVLLASAATSLCAEQSQSTIEFQSSATSVASTIGTIFLTVMRSGDTTQPASASVVSASGTALSGTDFQVTTGAVNFGVGDTSEQVQVTIFDRTGQVTYPITFDVTLISPGGNGVIGSPSTETVTINSGTGTSTSTGTGTSTAGTATSGTATAGATGATTGSTTGSSGSSSNGCGRGGIAPAAAGIAALIALRMTGRRRR